MASISASHNTVMITRRPRKGYDIQVNACVQARSEAASNAGQITGTSTSDGRKARGSFAVAIAISAIFVTVIVLATHVRFADVVVAFAPGAMDAMLALALTLHIDPIFVGAHHLSRFVFVSITTPGIVHLFGRPQEDVDD